MDARPLCAKTLLLVSGQGLHGWGVKRYTVFAVLVRHLDVAVDAFVTVCDSGQGSLQESQLSSRPLIFHLTEYFRLQLEGPVDALVMIYCLCVCNHNLFSISSSNTATPLVPDRF